MNTTVEVRPTVGVERFKIEFPGSIGTIYVIRTFINRKIQIVLQSGVFGDQNMPTILGGKIYKITSKIYISNLSQTFSHFTRFPELNGDQYQLIDKIISILLGRNYN